MKLHKRLKLRSNCAATIADIRQRYEAQAAQFRCPVHARPPVVKVTGTELESLHIQIEGCCPDFAERVRQDLRATL